MTDAGSAAGTGEVSVEVLVDGRALLGECPVWDTPTASLVWVDGLRREVHRYDPASGTDAVVVRTPGTVTAAVPTDRGGLAVAQGTEVGCASGAGFTSWGAIDIGDRTNDAGADPAGRLWVGTLTIGGSGAALYRLDGPGRLVRVLDDLGLANGMAWSADCGTYYLADTIAEQILAFGYDAATGSLSDRRVFADLHDVPGRPDGLCLDTDGGMWVCTAKGGLLVRLDADGNETYRLALGTPGVTSCAFGGPELTDLYVTSMCVGRDEAELLAYPRAGSLMRVHGLGVRGLPVPVVRDPTG